MLAETLHQVLGSKMLEGKVAVVYGAGGGVGSNVAKAFAREGAQVFLAGRTETTLRSVAQEILKIGKIAEISKVDALDPSAIEAHLKDIVSQTGKLDISFNLIGTSVAMGSRLVDISAERFRNAAFDRVSSYFITMTAAARVMEKQGNGVILGITAPNARLPRANMGGFSIGGAAIESLCRQLALEAGPKGVRVICLRTGGTPDNPVVHEVLEHLAKQRGISLKEIVDSEAQITALKRAPLLREVANAAVLLASDYASAITATTVNASCGELVD